MEFQDNLLGKEANLQRRAAHRHRKLAHLLQTNWWNFETKQKK